MYNNVNTIGYWQIYKYEKRKTNIINLKNKNNNNNNILHSYNW